MLTVEFSEDWSTMGIHWQELWTVVQWQDRWGYWHDVDGWQGTLDKVYLDDGQVMGTKTWWVADTLFGEGPFRWLVSGDSGGKMMVSSDPFNMPDDGSQTMTLSVSLEP